MTTTDENLIPWRLGYVALNVPDLDEAVEAWTRLGMLEVSETSEGTVHLRGGTDHHWVVLHESDGEPGLRRMAFEVQRREHLDAYRERLKNEGIQVTDHDGEWTGNAIRFQDPNGYEVELFDALGNVGITPTRPWVPPTQLLHAVVAVHDIEESFDFYGRVLGLLESDRVLGKTIFLRAANQFHHSLVLGGGRGTPPFLDHVAFHFADIDDLMRVRQNFLAREIPLDRDLLRHPTSGSMGFYAKGLPGPSTVEFCIDHAKITDPDYRPRSMAPGRWTSNVWVPPVDLD
ncbi:MULTISPECIES: VOC family protein [unclassified Nocardioides]|uniref:VOC family protein n=1 Tax=unclassified Nocardioides TaxID=2615069 RepID=UPI00361F9E9A